MLDLISTVIETMYNLTTSFLSFLRYFVREFLAHIFNVKALIVTREMVIEKSLL